MGNIIEELAGLDWGNEGTEPPASKKNEGWLVNEKPAPDFFNYNFAKTHQALENLDVGALGNHDLFAEGFVKSGLEASKNGTIATQLDVTSGIAFVKQSDNSNIERISKDATNFDTGATASTTFYLDLNEDGTYSWSETHSSDTNYLAIAEVVTDINGDISSVSDSRELNPRKFSRIYAEKSNNLPVLDIGEAGFATDTKEFFIGSSEGNVMVSGDVNAVETILIGSGEKFESLKNAIEYYSRKRKVYRKNDINNKNYIELVLKSGFILDEELHFKDIDVSFIIISSEDAEVAVSRESIITQPGTNLTEPSVFYGENSVLPIINTVFNFDESGTLRQVDGISVGKNSFVQVNPNCGVKNFTSRGLYVFSSSKSVARGSVFEGLAGEGSYGIYAKWGSIIDFEDGQITAGVTGHNIRAQRNSIINAEGCTSQNAGDYGLYANYASIINAENSTITNNGSAGTEGNVYCDRASLVNVKGSTLTGAASNGIFCQGGSIVNAEGCDVSNAGTYGVWCRYGGTVNIDNSIGTNAGDRAIFVQNDGRVNASNGDFTESAAQGIRVEKGSKANIQGSNFRTVLGADNSGDIISISGSIINANSATGGTNISKNTLTSDGIIFG